MISHKAKWLAGVSPGSVQADAVVGDEAFGDVPVRLKVAALQMIHQLNLLWATVVFDGRHSLLTITSARPPSDEAVDALGRLLAARAPA